MTTLGYPGKFHGVPTTGYRSVGAVRKANAGSAGYAGKFHGVPTTGYRNVGAVQKSDSVAYTLTIGQGSFALTGQSVTFTRALHLVVGQGSFALTGQAVTFTRALHLTIGQGSFALNGQAVSLLAPLDALARDLAWIKLLVEADEVHTATTVTKNQAGTATLLISKTFTGQPFSNLSLVQLAQGVDTYSGSTSISTLAGLAAAIRAIMEGDEAQTATLLSRYTKGTTTPILTKTVTGTPLVDLQALQ